MPRQKIQQPEADANLTSIRRKTAMVRDKARGVFLGYHPGVLLWGAGGIGKSWTVEDEARQTQVFLRRHTGVLTARALYEQLRRHPTDVHLIEDNEQLLAKEDAVTVLREATWTVERDDNARDDGRFPDRRVTWARHRDPNEFVFSGGLILIQNERPPQSARIAALLTRLRPHQVLISEAEIATLARHLAATAPPRVMGYQMTAADCTEVLDYLMSVAGSAGQALDMRLVAQAYGEYVQFQNGDADVDWRDHVRALVTERTPTRFTRPVDLTGATRREKQERDRATARAILDETTDAREQVRLWKERTGKCQSMFYERRREVKQLEGE